MVDFEQKGGEVICCSSRLRGWELAGIAQSPCRKKIGILNMRMLEKIGILRQKFDSDPLSSHVWLSGLGTSNKPLNLHLEWHGLHHWTYCCIWMKGPRCLEGTMLAAWLCWRRQSKVFSNQSPEAPSFWQAGAIGQRECYTSACIIRIPKPFLSNLMWFGILETFLRCGDKFWSCPLSCVVSLYEIRRYGRTFPSLSLFRVK